MKAGMTVCQKNLPPKRRLNKRPVLEWKASGLHSSIWISKTLLQDSGNSLNRLLTKTNASRSVWKLITSLMCRQACWKGSQSSTRKALILRMNTPRPGRTIWIRFQQKIWSRTWILMMKKPLKKWKKSLDWRRIPSPS
ncbi:hypothetical protein IMSAGC015_02152 [Lachnospiraceae bacterium]|nr:hypothetical protein IMSAGC015_02152 [Lachnospiraceae bacterium]